MSALSPPSGSTPLVNANSRDENGAAGPRRTSLGFLKRSKSQEPFGRKSSGGKKLSKEQQREEELRRQRESIPAQAPALPVISTPPQLKGFGGEELRPDSVAIISNQVGRNFSRNTVDGARTPNRPTMPPVPRSSPVPSEDPYARTESMTHRGRYSYASSAVSTINSPRRVRRRKDPTPYNVLVIGAKNSGKTSFLNFLRTSLALPPKKRPTRAPEELESPPPSAKASRNFVHHYLESEIDGERVGLTLWDSQGLEKNVVDLQLREMSSFLESKFEDTFGEEMKVIRSPGVRDTHIHCVFFLLDPSRLDTNINQAQQQNGTNSSSNAKYTTNPRLTGVLDDDFELQILRTLQGKTTVVPVISKADTITTAHMDFLKRAVWDSLKRAGLEPLEALNFEEESEDGEDAFSDRLDERDEDEAAAQNGENGEPTTDDSDTVPEAASPTKRSKHRSTSSIQGAVDISGELPHLPMSILSPDSYSLGGDGPIGRKFPWGFADPYNPEHCDYVKLKENVFGEWRADLREASREVWYERWRTSRLNRQGGPITANGGRRMGILKSGRAL